MCVFAFAICRCISRVGCSFFNWSSRCNYARSATLYVNDILPKVCNGGFSAVCSFYGKDYNGTIIANAVP